MKNDDWKQDLYRYRLTPAPPKKDDFQEYIALYFAKKDEKYLSWFLHYYEPTLNTQIMTAVQEYSMRGALRGYEASRRVRNSQSPCKL